MGNLKKFHKNYESITGRPNLRELFGNSKQEILLDEPSQVTLNDLYRTKFYSFDRDYVSLDQVVDEIYLAAPISFDS